MDEIDTELIAHKHRLRIKNNWENLHYLRRHKEILPGDIKTVRIKGRLYKVSWKKERRPVYDHGFTYTTNTIVGYIDDDLGVPVPLDKVIVYQKIFVK
jgi:hypothetical protein